MWRQSKAGCASRPLAIRLPSSSAIGAVQSGRVDLRPTVRFVSGHATPSQMSHSSCRSPDMPIINRLADLQPEIAGWRRDIHAHPELLFDVHRTAASVADKLRSFGCDEVVTGIGRTGVVGVIHGRKPAEGSFKAIGLRADMDALPIMEA